MQCEKKKTIEKCLYNLTKAAQKAREISKKKNNKKPLPDINHIKVPKTEFIVHIVIQASQ